MSDTPETDAIILRIKYNPQYIQKDAQKDIGDLERERDEYKAQRDRLAVALRLCASICAGESMSKCELVFALTKAKEALAAVKGDNADQTP